MDATMRLPGRQQTGVVEDASEVNTSGSKNVRILMFLVLLVVAIYGVVSWFRIDSLKESNGTLSAEVTSLKGEIKGLKADVAATGSLRSQLSTVQGQLSATKADLGREIARKAVENTQLKGRVTQAERDLQAALNKIALLEKKRPARK